MNLHRNRTRAPPGISIDINFLTFLASGLAALLSKTDLLVLGDVVPGKKALGGQKSVLLSHGAELGAKNGPVGLPELTNPNPPPRPQ